MLKQCGITTLTKPADFYGMSLILGGCEISPFELAGVYSSMARIYNHQLQNKGQWNGKDWFMPQYFKIPDAKKKISEKNTLATAQQELSTSLFDYTALWHTFNAMNEVMRPGEEGLWNLFSSAQRIAWKTGTSFGFRDGWAIGITPKYCVVVWVGNTTGVGRPELTGINTAGPILFDIFRLLPKSAWFNPPSSGFNYINICRQSGFKASVDCGATDTVMVSDAAKNAPVCPYCRKINLDKTGTYRVNDNCESPADMLHQSWFILPPTIEYYYLQKHPDYKTLPLFKPGCNADGAKVLDIIYPEEGAKIYVPIEANGNKGKTVFTATHRIQNTKLFWHLDDDYLSYSCLGHTFPVNEDHLDKQKSLLGATIKSGYSSQYVLTTKEGHVYKPASDKYQNGCEEIVIAMESQCLPAFIITLDPISALKEYENWQRVVVMTNEQIKLDESTIERPETDNIRIEL